MVLTKPMCKAVDIHTRKHQSPHHNHILETQLLYPQGSSTHGIFYITPEVAQAGQLDSLGNTIPNTQSTREGGSIRVRSWKISVNIEQLYLISQVDQAPVLAQPSAGLYQFDIWIAVNKLETERAAASVNWDAVAPFYKNTAWRIQSGLTPNGYEPLNPLKARLQSPNTSQMTILAKKSFRVKAAGYIYAGAHTLPPVTHANAAMGAALAEMRPIFKRINFSIKSGMTKKYPIPTDPFSAVEPMMYIQYRRLDGQAAHANLFQARMSAQLLWDNPE